VAAQEPDTVEPCLLNRGVPRRQVRALGAVRETPVIAAVREFAAQSSQWCLVLHGAPGAGKSFAAAHWLSLWAARVKASESGARLWLPACDLADLERPALAAVRTVAALVIDDLGAEYASDSGWLLSRLYSLLSARYDAMAPTVITTNLAPADFPTRYADQRLLRRLRGETTDGVLDVRWWPNPKNKQA
jgi:DNA replication protein DnaC